MALRENYIFSNVVQLKEEQEGKIGEITSNQIF
jgi:hypothetical protein